MSGKPFNKLPDNFMADRPKRVRSDDPLQIIQLGQTMVILSANFGLNLILLESSLFLAFADVIGFL